MLKIKNLTKDDLTKMTDEKELNRLCLYIYMGILDYLENR